MDDPIESTNGLSDELGAPTCNTSPPGPPNLLVADTRLGPLANNGGPTDTMALLEGSPGIDGGTPTECPSTDQRGTARPQRVRCDIGAYEAAPVQSSPPPPGGEEELPPPVVGKQVNALPKSGTVKIKLPGTNTFVLLDEDTQIPVGTIVDTRKGRITLVAAANKSGGTAKADFYDGLFKVTQTKGKKPITVLTLVEKLTGCKANGQGVDRQEEGQEAAAVGRRQGPLPDQGQAQRGDGRRHEVAGRGPLHVDADEGRSRQGPRARLREEEDGAREGRQEVRRARQAVAAVPSNSPVLY